MGSNAVTASRDRENHRVIVTEDETLIRFNIAETLTGHGFEAVGGAASGKEAVELALELELDLMVMDIKMPRLDGISAVDKTMKEVPYAIMMPAAFPDRELIEQAKGAETVAYLIKSFQAKDLIPVAEVALSRHQEMLTPEDSIVDLQDRLATRKQVDRARGLLAEKMDLSEPETFRWIQKTLIGRRLSIYEVADTAIEQLGNA